MTWVLKPIEETSKIYVLCMKNTWTVCYYQPTLEANFIPYKEGVQKCLLGLLFKLRFQNFSKLNIERATRKFVILSELQIYNYKTLQEKVLVYGKSEHENNLDFEISFWNEI